MTIKQRAHKIWSWNYQTVSTETATKDIELELTQFFSEIKKRCKEECRKTTRIKTPIQTEYERNRTAAEIEQAIDQMEIE